MDTIMEIVKNLDWTPLFISFKTGIVATVISFFLGLFAARKVIHAGERVKAIADGFLTLPMVLPPTVAGFFLLLLFSKRRPIGMFLFEQFGTDSRLGRIASVMMSSSETIFYTMSIYFMIVKVKKTRWTLAGALVATVAGIMASVLLVG